MTQKIIIQNARTHNLKNISVEIPKNKLVVITGLSGSGKSSLAFDTLYAEGQRRYIESLSAYARQFLGIMEKPDVDDIKGLSPAISIEQKTTSHNPRSTVGTVTEIYDYLRILFARVGIPQCPEHQQSLQAQTISQMVDKALSLPKEEKIMLLAPVVRERKGTHAHLLIDLQHKGFIRARIDGVITDLDATPNLDKNKSHTIEVIIDRFKIRKEIKSRLADSFETALELTQGLAVIEMMDHPSKKPLVFSSKLTCTECGYSLPTLEPRMFSFNNPLGACTSCDGLGMKQVFDPEKIILSPDLTLEEGAILGWDKRSSYYFCMLASLAQHYQFDLKTPFNKLPKKIRDILLYGSKDEKIHFTYLSDRHKAIKRHHVFEGIIPNFERRYHDTDSLSIKEDLAQFITKKICSSCQGARLKQSVRHVYIDQYSLPYLLELPIDTFFTILKKIRLTGSQGIIAKKILLEIKNRLQFLLDVGLNYLALNRGTDTLSNGEVQRIRLASQIGSGLTGVMYVLDEPSIGLHQRDNQKLLDTLFNLRNLGNTVIIVEHDEEAIRNADYILDIGPGAGVHGGEIIAQGSLKNIMKVKSSLTGQYLSGKKTIAIPTSRRVWDKKKCIVLKGCTGNNLKNVTITIPAHLITCITGVSGSGKSTLINQTLQPIAAKTLNRATKKTAAPYHSITGLEHFDKCINIDQSPIGRTPRSNPATYTQLFTSIRELFASTEDARAKGYKVGRFSFNVKGGRCEACQGDGSIKVEMHFLPDIYVTCDVCQGKRYNRETLDIKYKKKTISDVLAMTVEEAASFFSAIPVIKRKLDTLMDVGLSYILLGQNAITLSGGEAQRIKIARELSKREMNNTLYILDEPTTGLHFEDIQQLLNVLQRLCNNGSTIVIIEHNLDVIKTADWIIDLGPEGGDKGGYIIAKGTPEEVAKIKKSHTGRFLKTLLS